MSGIQVFQQVHNNTAEYPYAFADTNLQTEIKTEIFNAMKRYVELDPEPFEICGPESMKALLMRLNNLAEVKTRSYATKTRRILNGLEVREVKHPTRRNLRFLAKHEFLGPVTVKVWLRVEMDWEGNFITTVRSNYDVPYLKLFKITRRKYYEVSDVSKPVDVAVCF